MGVDIADAAPKERMGLPRTTPVSSTPVFHYHRGGADRNGALGTHKRRPAPPLLLAASLFGALPAPAQSPPAKPAAPATDAAFDAQKAAFLALPLLTRTAAQDALVWLGFYNGATEAISASARAISIAAFELSQKAPGDGLLSAGQLQALLAAGRKARAAVGFKTIVDPSTGARIGAPTKLLDARSGVTLDFASDAGGDLAGLYVRLAAGTASRKVSYKAMKPGAFLVVSGEDRGRKFYTRYDLSARATPPIRGFTFAYPAQRNDLDRIALAVANAFEAFPEWVRRRARRPRPPGRRPLRRRRRLSLPCRRRRR